MQERKRANRWQINHPAKLKLEGAEAFCDCTIHDLNFKGMRVSLGVKLAKDNFIKLKLYLTDDFIFDTIEAWVVWEKAVDGTNIYGLFFSRIKDGDKEKIYQFMRSYFRGYFTRQWWQDASPEKGGEAMEQTRIEDKRIFERFTAKVGLRFMDLLYGIEGEAQTHDISAKGIGMVTDKRLAPKSPLEIWLGVPDNGEPLYARGEVVWSMPVSENKYRIGVNLEKADLMGLSRVLRVQNP